MWNMDKTFTGLDLVGCPADRASKLIQKCAARLESLRVDLRVPPIVLQTIACTISPCAKLRVLHITEWSPEMGDALRHCALLEELSIGNTVSEVSESEAPVDEHFRQLLHVLKNGTFFPSLLSSFCEILIRS